MQSAHVVSVHAPLCPCALTVSTCRCALSLPMAPAAITAVQLCSKTVPAGEAPLAPCVSAATTHALVPPCPLIDSDRASPPPNSGSEPSRLCKRRSSSPPAAAAAAAGGGGGGTHAGSDPRSGASIPSSSPPWPRSDTARWKRPSAVATCRRATSLV